MPGGVCEKDTEFHRAIPIHIPSWYCDSVRFSFSLVSQDSESEGVGEKFSSLPAESSLYL